MITKTKYLIIILLTFVFTGCSADIELKDYIDKSAPFQLIINQTDVETGLTTRKTIELIVNSEKWKKLIEWEENNKDGWQSSPASYIADISVIQGNFRLLYLRISSGVVISFIDKQGKSKQYIKTIPKGDLDFLTSKKTDSLINPNEVKYK